MSARQDVIELLLPQATAPVAALARRVTTFARLLCDDAPRAEAERVALNLERARAELESESRERLLGALEELMRLHLDAALGPGSFLCSGEAGDAPRAWRLLEDLRDELPVPFVPQPGERDADVARRLLQAATKLAHKEESLRAWSAQLERASAGPAAGVRAFRELLSQGNAASLRARRVQLAGLAACLLDQGRVREAAALLDAEPARLADATLRRLHGWCRLLLGDTAGAREALARAPAWRGILPSPLAELREERPEWLPLLTGKAPAAAGSDPGTADAASHSPALSRGELGAVLLAVFRLDGQGDLALLHADAAPGVREQLEAWIESREGACSEAAEYEHLVVVRAAPVRVHRHGEPLRGTIAPARVMAVALEPVLCADGEVGGWLRVECEHHLLPSSPRLAALAARWQPHVSRAPAPSPLVAGGREKGARSAEVFEALVRELGMKMAQRHWWGFEVRGARLHLSAEGGSALAEGPRGGGRAVERALLTGGSVRFDEPSLSLSLHSGSASGIVLPLACGGRTCGLLAVESPRRRDVPGGAEGRLAAPAAWGAQLRLAQLSDWHRERFGCALHFSRASPAGAELVDEVLVAARARAPVALWGPAGSGRRSVARWLHFEARARGPLLERACSVARGDPPLELAQSLGEAAGGTLVLAELEAAPPALQEQLLALLDRCEGGCEPDARLVLASNVPLHKGEPGTLSARLGARMERLLLRVPALEERREELPVLVPLLLERFALEQGRQPPVLDDEAMALLWRQPWEGHVRQLSNLLFKLALFAPGARVGAAQMARMAGRFQVLLRERLPSRHPRPEWLRAALRTTCTQKRTLNKTRAALYLGWDPDTLAARMRDLGVPDGPEALELGEDPACPPVRPSAGLGDEEAEAGA